MLELNKDTNISCEEENKNLIKHFLNRNVFRNFKSSYDNDEIYRAVELQLRHTCNQNCSYCYYAQHAHGKELNSNSVSTIKNIVKNADIFANFLEKHKLFPKELEVFGGEVLTQRKIIYPVLRRFLEYYHKYDKSATFIIPTNLSFVRKERFLNDFIEFKKEVEDKGSRISLSASIDGKYLDPINRNMIGKDPEKTFTDEYYDKIFTNCKKIGYGFHPMIHYDGIKKWKDNWLWFQKNFEKYNIPWNNVYLLEVRNDGWTKESAHEYYKFMKFLNHWCFDFLGNDKKIFLENFIFGRADKINNLNIWNNFINIGRGIGCSMQSVLSLRLGDLMVVPCHRQSYDALNGFKFITENDEITDIEVYNLEFYFSNITMHVNSLPYCNSCLLKNICSSGCPGSQFEFSADIYLPIPSVCLVEHAKVKAQIDFLVETGMFKEFLSMNNETVKNSYYNFYNLQKRGK